MDNPSPSSMDRAREFQGKIIEFILSQMNEKQKTDLMQGMIMGMGDQDLMSLKAWITNNFPAEGSIEMKEKMADAIVKKYASKNR